MTAVLLHYDLFMLYTVTSVCEHVHVCKYSLLGTLFSEAQGVVGVISAPKY